jgi:hypothetical protein
VKDAEIEGEQQEDEEKKTDPDDDHHGLQALVVVSRGRRRARPWDGPRLDDRLDEAGSGTLRVDGQSARTCGLLLPTED